MRREPRVLVRRQAVGDVPQLAIDRRRIADQTRPGAPFRAVEASSRSEPSTTIASAIVSIERVQNAGLLP